MKKAFTLIELLVSISIISIMMSFILPSLSSTKENSRSVSCSVNLKNTIQSVIMYGNDYKDLLPYAREPLDIRIPNMEPYESLASYLTGSLPFYDNNHQVKTFSPFSCPSDKEISKNTGFSYTYNLWDLMRLWPGNDTQYTVSKMLLNYQDEVIFMDVQTVHGNKKKVMNIARISGEVTSFLAE